MNGSGILSAYSASVNPADVVYSAFPVFPAKERGDSDAQLTTNPFEEKDINDEAVISDEAKTLFKSEENQKKSSTTEELTPAQEQEIKDLKARDAEVKTHEQAHMAAAAGIGASSPSYKYEIGPDGKRYAVGGEVNLSFTQNGDPRETIAKATIMRAAALAPISPSAQDRAVAREASQIIAEAQQKMAQEQKVLLENIGNLSNTQETASLNYSNENPVQQGGTYISQQLSSNDAPFSVAMS